MTQVFVPVRLGALPEIDSVYASASVEVVVDVFNETALIPLVVKVVVPLKEAAV